MTLRAQTREVVAEQASEWHSLAPLGGAMALIYLLFSLAYPITSYYGVFIPGAQQTKPVSSFLERNVIAMDGVGYFALAILLHVLYFAALFMVLRRAWAPSPGASQQARRLVLGVGVACALILIWTYPLFSQDVFDYSFHTRMWTFLGGNPFTNTPDMFSADRMFRYVAWTGAPSPYGPLWIMLTAPLSLLAGSSILSNLLLFKGLTVLAYGGTTWLIYQILGKMQPRYQLAGTVLFAWNPFILIEFAVNGHNDIVMLFFMALAVWLLINDRYSLSIVALVTAGLVKVPAVLVIPFFAMFIWRRLPARSSPGERVVGVRARLRAFIREVGLPTTDRRSFATQAGVLSVLLVVAAYAPLWDGFRTLSFLTRGDLSGGAPIYYPIQQLLDGAGADRHIVLVVMKVVSLGGFGLIYLYLLWVGLLGRLGTPPPVGFVPRLSAWTVSTMSRTQPGSRLLADLRRLTRHVAEEPEPASAALFRSSFLALFAFAFVGTLYFQPWYMSWILIWLPFLLHPRSRWYVWPLLAFCMIAVASYVLL